MSFIRPILEYADVIWDSQNQSLINKLENASHYILLCSRFADIRQELILSISNIPVNITINLLLFGTNELTDEQNT
jgi:hypothetical protein